MTRSAIILCLLFTGCLASDAAAQNKPMTVQQYQSYLANQKAKQNTINSIRSDSTAPQVAPELTPEQIKAAAAQADYNQQQQVPAALHTRSPLGLLITRWSYSGSGWIRVTLRNITGSSLNFDCHQLLGAELDTGLVAAGSNVKFDITKIASYSVPAGGETAFAVQFSGRQIAALSWPGIDCWVESGGTVVATKDQAAASVLRLLAAKRVKERSANLIQVKDGYVQK